MPGKPISDEALARDLAYITRSIRVHEVLAQVVAPREGLLVCEPGCGSGKLSYWYVARGALAYMLDVDWEVLQYTKALGDRLHDFMVDRREWNPTIIVPTVGLLPERDSPDEGGRDFYKEALGYQIHHHSETHTAKLLHMSVHDMSKWFGESFFDFTYNEGVSHHWPPEDPRRQAAITEMVKVTKPGGWVCVIGSNAHCPAMMEYARTTSHTYQEMPPTQTPLTRIELAEKLVQAGLKADTVQVIPVDGPWEQSLLLAGWGQKK